MSDHEEALSVGMSIIDRKDVPLQGFPRVQEVRQIESQF